MGEKREDSGTIPGCGHLQVKTGKTTDRLKQVGSDDTVRKGTEEQLPQRILKIRVGTRWIWGPHTSSSQPQVIEWILTDTEEFRLLQGNTLFP